MTQMRMYWRLVFMKRKMFALALVLLCTLVLSGCQPSGNDSKYVSSDNRTKVTFEIRNGIKFGMTIDEVRNIEEKVNKCSAPELDPWIPGRLMAFGPTLKDSTKFIIYSNTSVASIPYSSICYVFDEGRLVEIAYLFKNAASNESSAIYQEVKDAMVKKYGTPTWANTVSPFANSEWSVFALFRQGRQSSEWLVENNKTYIAVGTFYAQGQMSSYFDNLRTDHVTGAYYRLVSNEEYLSVIEQTIEEVNAVNSDL